MIINYLYPHPLASHIGGLDPESFEALRAGKNSTPQRNSGCRPKQSDSQNFTEQHKCFWDVDMCSTYQCRPSRQIKLGCQGASLRMLSTRSPAWTLPTSDRSTEHLLEGSQDLHLIAMASSLEAMASNLLAMASKRVLTICISVADSQTIGRNSPWRAPPKSFPIL